MTVLALAACATAEPKTQVVRVVETVTVEVTRIVEVASNDASAPASADSDAEVADSASEPAMVEEEVVQPTSTPFPTLTPTPAPTGQRGDFTREDLDKVFEVWELVEDEFYGDLPSDEVLVDAMIAAMAVSYTHLTLPTTPYV